MDDRPVTLPKLLPCPFCGEAARIDNCNSNAAWIVRCVKEASCSGRGGAYPAAPNATRAEAQEEEDDILALLDEERTGGQRKLRPEQPEAPAAREAVAKIVRQAYAPSNAYWQMEWLGKGARPPIGTKLYLHPADHTPHHEASSRARALEEAVGEIDDPASIIGDKEYPRFRSYQRVALPHGTKLYAGPPDRTPAAIPPARTAEAVDDGLTFAALRRANIARLPLFRNKLGDLAHRKAEGAHSVDGSDWSPAQWLQAVVGEIGEYANLRKKHERGDVDAETFKVEAGKELADVVIYLDILAKQLGIDLGFAATQKFNEVSDRIGCNVKLPDRTADRASEGNTPERAVKDPDRGRAMYAHTTDNDPIVHSNRFPSWRELSQSQRDEWNAKADRAKESTSTETREADGEAT